MKKIFFGVIIGLSLTSIVAFKIAYEAKKNTAEVDQVQGVYVFVKSKPVQEYEFIGTVAGPTFGSDQMDEMVGYMIKRMKKDYPNANGILFDGPIRRSDNTKVSAIKIKE